jgi:putative ABC transport system substrate-binding protein
MHSLSRRAVVGGLAGLGLSASGLTLLASACSLAPGPQQPRIPRIGYLTVGPREVRADRIDAFLQGLREFGYIESQTISIEWRFWSDGGEAELSKLADDLVRSAVDLIVTDGSAQVSQAAMRATTTVPILAVNVTSPVQSGLVASLGRPGANLTAIASSASGATTKRIELLRDIVPGLARVISFVDPANPSNIVGWEESHAVGEAVGLQVDRIDLISISDFQRAFESPLVSWAQAVHNVASAFLLPVRVRLAELALRHRLPATDINRVYAEAGLLMTYGPKGGPVTQSRRAAVYVDKILKGAKPADLPVDQPTEFDLVINTRTAQALGVTIPPDVAAQVTDWIQ